MKRLMILVCALVLLTAPSFAQIDTVWTKTLHESGTQSAMKIVAVQDGFVVAGRTTPTDGLCSDILLVKVNTEGVEQWRKTYGCPLSDVATDLSITPDGGFVITGWTHRAETANRDLFVMKLDAAGDSVWYKLYAGDDVDEGRGVAVAPDGKIYVFGSTSSVGAGRMDELLLTFSAEGDSLNAQTFGGNKSDQGSAITIDSEGNLYTAGAMGSVTTGNRDVHLLKINPSGEVLINKTYNSNNFDWPHAVLPLSDGDIAIGSDSDVHTQDFMSQHLFLLNGSGDRKASMDISEGPFYEHCRALAEMPNGIILLAGSMNQNTSVYNRMYINAVDEYGSLSAKGIFDIPTKTVWIKTIVATDDGAVVAGYIGRPRSGEFDVFLAKVTIDVSAVPERTVTLPTQFSIPTVAPNPFNGQATVSFEMPRRAEIRLSVFDLLGREVTVLHQGALSAGEQRFAFQGDALVSGVYFLRLESEGLQSTVRMVLVK